ncbi:MAG: trehalose-6-phosphate synthase [Bdellovibrionaceae bacterium]|nr:trehalose-6-phosphate synthase [Pseudobdellovibrionaceae bacterium]
MRLSLRFILPLIFALGIIAYAIIPLADSLIFKKWFTRDIEIRGKLIVSTLQDSIISILEQPTDADSKIQKVFGRAIQDERLYALAFCNLKHQIAYKTQTFPKEITCETNQNSVEPTSEIINLPKGPLHIAYHSIDDSGKHFGRLVLVHDISFLEKRSSDTKAYIFYLFIALGAVISLITVFIAQLSWRGWVKGMRAILKGEGLMRPNSQTESAELSPIVKDLRLLIQDLDTERRTRDVSKTSWDARSLKEILNSELMGDEVLIISNREPYIHVKRNEKIEIQFPASGLVTALEPIMRSCSGTWIAHGSGNADRDVVDKNDRVRVPPNDPSYQIRRVWLTKEEEQGYYYGFSNEGIWALCHIAHVRPIFRSSDWAQYVAANEKFANAVVQEAKTDDPVVLVQDYHLALLPKLIKERLPKATIITFWHIPFPNPEVFGICPWRDELLSGLLGSDILGFHTRFHCNNFLDTVDRFIESRVDRETSTVTNKGQLTSVDSYPISIEYPAKWMDTQKPVLECRQHIRKLNNLPQSLFIGIGVDRLDYTKGILERFMAVERLFELEPKWIGKFSFIQIAAPSRSSIPQYQHFESDVRALAIKINNRYGQEGYSPIILKVEHHDPQQVYEYYRGSEICFVSSLHDGMNLVAKEFIASRDDEQGVLILSQFTGASRELLEALIVNPYNIDQCAAALHVALEMPKEEQRNRIRSMRGLIQEFNVYRWAGRMLLSAGRLRKRKRLFGHIKDFSIGILKR